MSHGFVLVAGGETGKGTINQTAERYNPPTMPEVKLTDPVNGSIAANKLNLFTNTASDVAWEDIEIDGKFFKASPPNQFNWDTTTVTDGVHHIETVVFNGSGQHVGSDTILVKVVNKTPAYLAQPYQGETVSGKIDLVTQKTPEVSWIDVDIDGNFFRSSPGDMFSWDTTTVANGSHQISVVAFGPGGTRLGTDTTAINVAN